ncbi:WD repeat-containing protein 49 [Xyrauchen texanus]|uniref:WD repeat-containing protein 49 n=1 Tax=Xyrauchen texanus TaxID=154827 RepID=UPI0022428FB0|nr:WD repeat-containing protein 49 [Xyrauchen texanus]
MLQHYKQSRHSLQTGLNFSISEPLICHCVYNKQEPIIRFLALSQSPPMRYISISKGGTLCVWNSRFNILKQLEVCSDLFDESDKKENCKKFRGWTTDAVYMGNVHKIAVATMNRDIHFFDVITTSCFKQVYLFGLSYAATALCYWYNTKAPGEKCVLMWGDEKGSVNLLWILQPLNGLLDIPFTNQSGPVQIYMPDINAHSAWISYQHIPKIHSSPINRIQYEPRGELIITSSESAASSVVIIDINQKRQKYIWRIEKGVKCFDFSFSLSMLVTAGVDPVVRLWNRYVTSHPIAVLHSHQTSVVDVVIHQELGKIFSYAKDAVLKIWDIPSQQCVKTVRLKFPNFQPGFTPEQGSFPLLLNLTVDHALLVTCREYLAMLRLHKAVPRNRPGLYTCALYNPHLEQVIVASADSSLAMWDVKTGIKKMEIRNAHGKEEISCMVLDNSQRKLISAATNGTIKVWNLLNGHNLHKLEAVSNTEVTGIICHHDNQLIATGWSRLIAQYSIAFSNDIFVKADLSWKSGRQHSDDILAMDQCPGLGLLATGSYDGEIIIWTLALQKPITRLQRSQQGKVSPPVRRLLFLQRRAQQSHLRSSAVLLSSQAGSVCWWSICGPQHNHGQFYAPDKSDESVMGLSTDQENNLLITGDTTGSIKVWDISLYALSNRNESAKGFPPLLHFWRAHERAIVSSEFLVYGSQLFLLSVSEDHKACLWTTDGGSVGWFGQQQQWELSNPDTYQIHRQCATLIKEGEEERTESSQSCSGPESFICWGEGSGEVTGTSIIDVDCQQTELALDQQMSHLTLQTPHQESTSGHHSSFEKFQLPKYSKFGQGHEATVQSRRRGIDRKKLFCFGEVTPFRALELPEISEPVDLPLEPWILKKFQLSSRQTELSSHILSSEGPVHFDTLE